MTARPAIDVAVILRKVPTSSRWQPWRWELAEVVPNEEAFGTEPRRCCYHGDRRALAASGLRVELFRDDAEGYYLNATTAGAVLVRAVADGGGRDDRRRADPAAGCSSP
jgi:hypothetical protein